MTLRPLSDPSERSVRAAVAAAVPELANARIELPPPVEASEPDWHAGTAILDGRFVAKFAWSEQAAVRISREAAVLETLALAAPGLPVARVVGASDDPVVFVTERVAGAPLRYDDVRALAPRECAVVAAELASFLAALHAPAVLARARERVPALVRPEPQGNTPALRARLPRFLDRRRADLALAWCDWLDDVLGAGAPPPVLAHGDLHGYNQLWDRSSWTLRLVADFEVTGPADPEYDLRYFPSQAPTLALVDAIQARYTALCGRSIDLHRVMAWHVRTALGDALWRSEAGVALPGGGTPASYVDDIERKLATLAAV